ncbi:glycosyltransferase family 4 protein [Candidatus Pseudothioglobus sp. Uisw_050_01]|uniref:glycosyltransferase family 4 protein n=1 Tax=Candidatus Pseudothioglobus sp. Uisw_050_01 TaxID=3230997 RepID=UPI003A853257
MNKSQSSLDSVSPVRMAVIFDQILNVGGGYQQAINAATLVKKVNNKYCHPIFFTNHLENVDTLKLLGIEVIYLNISKLSRLFLKIRGIVSSQKLAKFLNKLIGLNSFEKALVDKDIDLVYFISPSGWAGYLEQLNYITTVWDLCHRDYPEFPEVRYNRTFEERESSYRKTLIKAVAVMAESELGKENIIRRYGVDENRTYVMPFSEAAYIKKFIDGDYDKAINIREKYSIPEDYIFYPAQFWAHKNHVYILQGLKILKENYGVIISAVFAGGDGGNLAYVKKIAYELDILDQLIFVGFVEDEMVPHIYNNSIALVMPTYFGPTNIPPLEAFTLGVPVLYSDLDGLREQVEGAALLLDLNNPDSMAVHINKLIHDKEFKKNLVIAGKQKLKVYEDDYRLNVINEICRDFQSKRYCWNN